MLLLCTATSAAWADELVGNAQFDIPSQSLATALLRYSQQASVQVVVSNEVAKTRTSTAVQGEYPKAKALEMLLRGSGLTFHVTAERTVAISEEKTPTAWEKNQDEFRVAQMDQGESAAAGAAGNLEEIIVTARKKEEKLQETPVPVSVIDTQALTESNQVMLRDLNGTVPALSVTPGIENQQSVTIRGLSTGVYGIPTVAITVDDVPLTNIVPDFDPGDITRIEVLRGPQGTLYGANSIGGLLKYVTTDPSTGAFSARLQAGTSHVSNGAEPGYNFRGSINMPVTDTLALRASAFTRQDPGYIDDVLTGQDGVNKAHVYGGKVSALWSPSQAFSLKLSAVYEHMEGGEPLVYLPTPGYPGTAGLGDLQQNEVNGGGDYTRAFELYSANIKAHLGGIDLVSITGYNITKSNYSWDGTWAYGSAWQAFLNLNYQPGSEVAGPWTEKIFTQEVRAAAQIGNKLDWQLGVFYSHDVIPVGAYAVLNYAVTPITGRYIATGAYFGLPAKSLVDYAAFCNLTYRFTERLDVQVGARESVDQPHTGESVTLAPLFNFNSSVAGLSGNVNHATYSFTPRYKIADDLMVYSRIASGYQPGGPNSTVGVQGVPQAYGASTSWNYEVGFKGELLDHRLSVDTSVYYIDWQKLQVALTVPPGISFTGNAGAAKSEGVELSLTARPFSGLTISGWVTYDDASLTEGFPSTATSIYGYPGEPLPYASRWSGNISLERKFPLSSQVTGVVGGTASYIGERMGTFTGGGGVSALRAEYPAYTEVGLHAGVNYASWSANLFVTNLADRRAIVGGGVGDYPPFAYQYITPRTVGLNLVATF